jgi:1-deoxy-D-xylulose-5-phosphate reductoisomerase
MRAIILGATGSLGLKVVDVCRKYKIKIVAISYGKNHDLASKIVEENKILNVYSPFIKSQSTIKSIFKHKCDIIFNCVSGIDGLQYTLLSIKNCKKVALANKESLVVAGKYIMNYCNKNKVLLYPLDSEHSSLFEAIKGIERSEISRLWITASGGALRNSRNLSNLNVEKILSHPNWKMGPKITVDSSTMMNKIFEMIEAKWYFPEHEIGALIEGSSTVHSIIEMKDGSLIIHASESSMKNVIELSLNYLLAINLKKKRSYVVINKVSFSDIDCWVYPMFAYANKILENISTDLPYKICVQNDLLVKEFLEKKIEFEDISKNLIKLIKNSKINREHSIAEVLKYIKNSRR